MHNLEQVLEKIGLTKKETAIYLASLELGSATAQAITKKAGIQRTYFYDLSARLISENLLRESIEKKKKLYVATSPENLIELEKERLKELRSILPELKAMHNPEGKKPKVYFYDGVEGINQINDDTLQYKGEIVGFTTPRFVLLKNKKFSREYIEKRKKLGISARVIGEDAKAISDLKTMDWKELRETRMLPANVFDSEIEVGVYGKKVFVQDYKQKYGLIIESKNLAHTLKQIFELVWHSDNIIKQ